MEDFSRRVDSAAPKIVTSEGAVSTQELQQAFTSFSEMSARLIARYERLRLETEQLRVQLKEKDETIRRGERLAMLGETAAAIAHEVRNPLGALKLFVSLLRQDVSEKPQALEMLDQMDKSLGSLDNVVSNILQFSRTPDSEKLQAQFAPVNVHAIVEEQIQILSTSKCHTCIEKSLGAEAFIQGIEHALRPMFYNLLLNAQQAVRHRGTVKVQSWNEGDLWCCSIQDSGSGIPEQLLPKVFDPFVTTKNEGTGLGLAIVRQIIEQHAGTIEVQNGVGSLSGACFTIKIPRQHKAMKVAA